MGPRERCDTAASRVPSAGLWPASCVPWRRGSGLDLAVRGRGRVCSFFGEPRFYHVAGRSRDNARGARLQSPFVLLTTHAVSPLPLNEIH
jgi:hypothetical protein